MTVTKAVIRGRLRYWDVNKPPNGYDQNGWSLGPDGNKYRNDCSGYVSMLCGITSNPNTAGMTAANYSRRITKDDLTFGDIMLAPAGARPGHVVMFDSWVDSSKTMYNGHDFGSGEIPRHKQFTYPYGDTRNFQPYRLLAVSQSGTDEPPMTTQPVTPPGTEVPATPTNEFPKLSIKDAPGFVILGGIAVVGIVLVISQVGGK